jgi:butyrate kinase
VFLLLDYIEKHSLADVRIRCTRAGGFVDLLGTSDADVVHAAVERGDKKATLVWNTMIYDICKMIGAMSAVLSGKVDAIILTGGVCHSTLITGMIQERISFIAPVVIYPGEDELESLAENGYGILAGEFEIKVYNRERIIE